MHIDKPSKPDIGQLLAQKRLARQNVPDAVREKEARLLKAKYLAAKKVDPSLNQEKIADICGWAGQSVVSQYLNAKIPLNLSALVKFAGVLNFDPSEVSPRLIESHPGMEVEHIYPKSPSGPRWDNLVISSRVENNALRMAPFDLRGDNAAPGEGEVALPFFREAELSAGQGTVVMLDSNGRKQIFAKSVLSLKNIDPEAAGCATVSGNSMDPVLPDGSIVGVDTASRSVQDGKMYALDHDGLLHVKLLYRLPGGGLRLKSYNDAEHPDERYDGTYVNQHIRVLGKVFWYSVLL
ncbi:helix-turn-helix transcriptional regulator [Pseudomonas lurida]|uniref:LexA family transcriptional regulator n=1 Tax=Pseudomonas lurida TaxID=244566 RepID=UPI001644E9F1|nr:helix-turn-helix transcriptional regulator [Pseudomonas lurida]MBC3239703.1 helix-turn-helix transcriptional regulator [Pseudomonas lurida]